MKRLFAIALLCTAFLLNVAEVHAQKVGVMGGATFSSIRDLENSSKIGWHVGGTVQFKLPLGFSIQPSLVYNAKAAELDLKSVSGALDMRYLELPVSFQWGPDLLIFRPFLDVSPYIGYSLSGGVALDTLLTQVEWKESILQRFEYGLGLGGGIEVWRFQLLCRYNWNFGPLFNDQGRLGMSYLEDVLKDKNFGGVTLSLAFLFGK